MKRAIKGELLLSTALEEALLSLKDGTVPVLWIDASFPSLKKLGGYIKDLLERLEWFTHWVEEGLPTILWISKFYFT
jgi:dynein heavy chain